MQLTKFRFKDFQNKLFNFGDKLKTKGVNELTSCFNERMNIFSWFCLVLNWYYSSNYIPSTGK